MVDHSQMVAQAQHDAQVLPASLPRGLVAVEGLEEIPLVEGALLEAPMVVPSPLHRQAWLAHRPVRVV